MLTNFNRILVGVDDSEDSKIALKYAINHAIQDKAELVIVSILESDEMNVYQALNKDFVHGERAELEKHLIEYKKEAQSAGVSEVRAIVAEGEPGETIVKEIIPQIEPDILIIGSEARKGIRRHFGSQAAYMAKYAPISVLVVR